MKTLNCIVLFVICAQILAIVEAQLLSRLLSRLLFSKRNSEEDDYPPYPRRSVEYVSSRRLLKSGQFPPLGDLQETQSSFRLE